jgi:hypothetical protein
MFMSTLTKPQSRRTRKTRVMLSVCTMLLSIFLLPLGLQPASAEEAPQPPGKINVVTAGGGFEGDIASFDVWWSEAGDKTGRTTTIDFTTMPGTADESDYKPVSGQIEFSEGGVYQPIDAITFYADDLEEGPEYLYLVFSNPANGAHIEEDQLVHKLWIHDETGVGNGYLQFWSEHIYIDEDAGSTNIRLYRYNAGKAVPVGAEYDPFDGKGFGEDASARYCMCSITAVKGVDFIGNAGALMFPKSAITLIEHDGTALIPFEIIDDDIPEETETFRIRITNIVGADPGAFNELIVHIIDND